MRLLLTHYHRICIDKESPYYLISKNIRVSFSKLDTIQTLWEKHDRALEKTNKTKCPPNQSLLDLKIELFQRIFSQCQLCEHQCNTDRSKQRGYCSVLAP